MPNRPQIPVVFFAALVLLFPSAAYANPVDLLPGDMAFFYIVPCALFMDAAVVTLVLYVSGLAALPVLTIYFLLKIALFAFPFLPLLSGRAVPVPALELFIVAMNALIIKFLASVSALQEERFDGVGWLRAVLTSLAGNAVSFLVGMMASAQRAAAG